MGLSDSLDFLRTLTTREVWDLWVLLETLYKRRGCPLSRDYMALPGTNFGLFCGLFPSIFPSTKTGPPDPCWDYLEPPEIRNSFTPHGLK